MKKRSIKIMFAVVLTLVIGLSMFACKKDEAPKETHVYENRYVTKAFYFSEGYPEDWAYMAGEEGKELAELHVSGNNDGYLCAKFFPKDEGDNGDVAMTVYKYDTKSMMNTLNGITQNLMDTESSYYLNDVFVEEERFRDSFTFTSDPDSEKPNHFQWNTATYKFVRDGEDWNGKFYMSTGNNTWFFLVCVEAKTEKWDAAYEIFKLMMTDFGFEGFEKSEE